MAGGMEKWSALVDVGATDLSCKSHEKEVYEGFHVTVILLIAV